MVVQGPELDLLQITAGRTECFRLAITGLDYIQPSPRGIGHSVGQHRRRVGHRIP
jgi:hypothetical protein